MDPLDKVAGAYIGIGTKDVPLRIPAGTFRSEAMAVPRDAGSCSFELRAVSDGTSTITIIPRVGNTNLNAVLVPEATKSPPALAAFTGSAAAIFNVRADFNFVQLDIINSGNDVLVYVVAAARASFGGTL
jgi:hypothetical protein